MEKLAKQKYKKQFDTNKELTSVNEIERHNDRMLHWIRMACDRLNCLFIFGFVLSFCFHRSIAAVLN